MAAPREEVISQLVERFFELRRDGRRESIDLVMDRFSSRQEDRAAIRDDCLRRISRLRRTAAGIGGSSGEKGLPVAGGEGEPPLPDLDGYYIIHEPGRGGIAKPPSRSCKRH